uniref:Uncharacterized protein n=1 Tax=Oryza rufipogon TaxID=4529 RepID=A0A0E0Q7C7_ORYRU
MAPAPLCDAAHPACGRGSGAPPGCERLRSCALRRPSCPELPTPLQSSLCLPSSIRRLGISATGFSTASRREGTEAARCTH